MDKSEFKKAMADNEAPTPGYLYRDMANWTHAGYATQLQLIKALVDKLQPKHSAFVLFKALHLVKVLCETGQEGFQKELQLSKYTNVMKDLTTYRGPLDIKYGDSWNEKVRREAQAALEAIFQTRSTGAAGLVSSTGLSSGVGCINGDWGGTGSSTVESGAVRGPWGVGEEIVMPSFAAAGSLYSNGGATFTSSSVPGRAATLSSSSAFDAPGLHVGEMPTENRWAAHQREMAAVGSSHAAEKPAKSILQHIASTAKSGVGLITQFEVLKGKQERLYGDQFGQAARATTGPDTSGALLGRGRGVDEVGSYQPVGFGMPLSASGGVYADPVVPVAVGRDVVPSSSSSTSPRPPAQTPQEEPSASLFTSPPPLSQTPFVAGGGGSGGGATAAATPTDAAEELLHALVRAKAAPSRVELSTLLRAIAESSATFATSDPPVDGHAYGAHFATALSAHLTLDRPWQERLNALTCLEVVLRGSVETVTRGAVAAVYTRQPLLVQANYSVVQASLKAKAERVAELLGIPPVPPSPAPPLPPQPRAAAASPPASAPSSTVGVAGDNAEPQRSHFDNLLGGSAAAPSLPPRSLWGSEDAFEGMQIRKAAGGGGGRRGDVLADQPQPSAVPAQGGGLGGDGATRPQRRTNRTTATTPPSVNADRVGSGSSSIQVLRSTVATMPSSAASAQRPGAFGGSDRESHLDDLLGLSSSSPASAPRAALPSMSTDGSTLDDLFGGAAPPVPVQQQYQQQQQRPASLQDHVTTDDLFAAPSTQAAEEPQQLARIQALMQHLETRYDPAAMAELEGLIMCRQQQLQGMVAQVNRSGGGGGGGGGGMSSAADAQQQPHREFQTGGTRSGLSSERQHANSAFANVQEEMKRKMEL